MGTKLKQRKTLHESAGLQEPQITAGMRLYRKIKNLRAVIIDSVRSSQQQEDFPLEQTGWLAKNPDALAMVKTGIAQAKEGRVKRMSFVEYADLEIDD